LFISFAHWRQAMAVTPPRLLTPAQTFRMLHELDRSMGGNYVSEILNVDFTPDRNFMYIKANSYREVDAFATRRFASLLFARQCSTLDENSGNKLTYAISTLMKTYSAMEQDGVPARRIFPTRIDLFDYLPPQPRRP